MSNYPTLTATRPSDFRVHVISLHADPTEAAGAAGGGGTHAYLRELLTALPRRGRSIRVITRRASAAVATHHPISHSADILRVQIGDLAPIDKRLLDAMHDMSVASVREALTACNAPIRLLHSVYWNSGRVALDLSSELGIPFVHTVISNGRRRERAGAEANGARRQEVEQQVFDAAFRIFCICPEERDDVVELYGIDPAKIIVIGRPVSVELLVPPHDELGNPHLLPPWHEVDVTSIGLVDTGAG